MNQLTLKLLHLFVISTNFSSLLATGDMSAHKAGEVIGSGEPERIEAAASYGDSAFFASIK
jgi:hypothetical protein